jgi:hypothetical protein
MMAHYAFLDQNNVVTTVIPGRHEDEIIDGISDWESYYGDLLQQVCKRTSYNTVGGNHLLGGTPFRKNYAGIGFIYDENLDAFIPPKPFDSWILDEEKCQWVSPVPYPENLGFHVWHEDTQEWKEVVVE